MDIPVGRDVVAYCATVVRSAKAALYLRAALAGVQVLSLRGCIGYG